MTFPISVSANPNQIVNGTANDGSVVNTNFNTAFNNDASLASGLNDIGGSVNSFGFIDGKYLILRNAFTGTPGSSDNGGLQMYRGNSAATWLQWQESNTFWAVSNDGSNFFPISLVVSSDPGSPSEGWIWYNTTSHTLKYYNGSQSISLNTQFPTRYQNSARPVYASSSTITFAYIECRDGTDTFNIQNNSTVTLNTATAGAINGLDTGSLATSTLYYVYAIGGVGKTAGVLFSTTNENNTGSITLPSGYTYKRQLAFAFLTDGSKNIIPFTVNEGWPRNPLIEYSAQFSYQGSVGGTFNVLNAGTASSATSVSCSGVIPGISQKAKLLVFGTNTSTPTDVWFLGYDSGFTLRKSFFYSNAQGYNYEDLPLSSSQTFYYKRNSGADSLNIDVVGYVVTVDL